LKLSQFRTLLGTTKSPLARGRGLKLYFCASVPLGARVAPRAGAWIETNAGTRCENRDFLIRLDQQRDGFRLLIVSRHKPVRPNWCPSDAESWKTERIPESYFARNRYAFQLRANPTRKISKERRDGTATKNGHRVPVRTREELVNWIKGKGEQGAFIVDEASLQTISRGREYFEKKGIRGLQRR
jgi:CRISPR-associated protein Cas6/Cse3/CasE subtype I-E